MPTKVELNRKRVSSWAKNNPEKYKLLQRKSHLKRYYNITLEKYEEMFNKQNGLCAICFNPEKGNVGNKKSSISLAVDHCHNTGKIRELLCMDCNQILGRFKEDPIRFQKAAEYLIKHREAI